MFFLLLFSCDRRVKACTYPGRTSAGLPWGLRQGQEDPLEKRMAAHSHILAWRIPWTEEPGGLQSMGPQRVGHDCATNSVTFTYFCKQSFYQTPCVCICVNTCARSVSSIMSNSVTLWTIACQAPVSLGFSRQEYGSGLPCPPPGDLRSPGIEPTFPVSPALRMDSLPLSLWGSPIRLFTVSHFEHVVFSVQPLTDCTYCSFLEIQI